jgi:hypothetical protein
VQRQGDRRLQADDWGMVVVKATANQVTMKRLGSTADHKCRSIWTVLRLVK